jgi:hypothetical protein
MQFQSPHKLVATPEGIFLEGQPLHKCDLGKLPERTLNHLLCAVETHGELTDKDWKQTAPPRSIRPRVHMDIHLAMANAGIISGFSLHKEFNPDQPRDSNGRWTAAGDTGKNGLERDRAVGDDNGLRVASNDVVVPVPWWFPVVPSRKHPEDDDPLGISSHPSRSSSSESDSSSSSESSSDDRSSSGSYGNPNDDFCKKHKQYCFSYCQYELGFPGRSGHDNMLKFRACVRKCMNDVGCSY